MKNKETLVYAVKHKDDEVIKKSSSGGLFTALSDLFFKDGNAVASCIYNNNTDRVEFKIYTDSKVRDMARGSKYIQAHIGDGFRELSDWLLHNPDKSILAVGTGCQMAGLCKYLEIKKLRDRVLIVDLICHGATSPGLWQKYIKAIGINKKIEYLSFKDKRNGWHNPSVYARVNGEECSISDFSEWFYGQWALREACYKCPYTKVKRETDLTIGDYWGIENVMPDFANPMGVSLLLIHSEAGRCAFDKIKESIEYRESNSKDCLQPRLISPAEKPNDRQKFWIDINDRGLEYCARQYKERTTIGIKKRVKLKVKRAIKKICEKSVTLSRMIKCIKLIKKRDSDVI